MGKDFIKFYKQLPQEHQQMLDNFGISSFEDMLGLAVMMGVDLDKLYDSMEDGSLASGKMKFEELLTDTNIPSMSMSKGSTHENDDPFAFPENCFRDEKPHELHLRIKLLNAPLPIWREIKVPSNITLEFFAFIINHVMGWNNTHLHSFTAKGIGYKNTVCLKMDREMDFGFRVPLSLDTNVFPISNFFKEKKDRIKYEYDFGDSWEHEIWLKGTREYNPEEEPMIKVHKGSGACPPEDCGGIWGYSEILRIRTKTRKTKDEKERLEWYGIEKDFDPVYFDMDETQDELEDLWQYALSKEF